MSLQENIGKLITTDDLFKKDAIHIAVAPVIATDILYPGAPLGFSEPGNTQKVEVNRVSPIGIVDPFLPSPVKEGEKFFMFLFPNTITGLRHDWIHPAFVTDTPLTNNIEIPSYTSTSAAFQDRSRSYEHLNAVAHDFGMSFEDFIHDLTVFSDFRDDDMYTYSVPDAEVYDYDWPTIWRYFTEYTGIETSLSHDCPYSCSC